jgi:hypothetical protein
MLDAADTRLAKSGLLESGRYSLIPRDTISEEEAIAHSIVHLMVHSSGNELLSNSSLVAILKGRCNLHFGVRGSEI